MSLGFIGTFTAMTLPQTLLPILIYVAVSLYYRIHTQLHTKEQIAVGLGIGVLNGALWRSLCSGTNPLFPSVPTTHSITCNTSCRWPGCRGIF